MKGLVMKILFVLVALLAVAAFAQPENILIYHDTSGSVGGAVSTAAANLWPSANILTTSGTAMQGNFNDALTTAAWDIVVVESWYDDSDGLDWAGITSYFSGGGCLYVSTWEWTNGTSGQSALGNSMGVSSFATFGSPVIPHYAWEPSHAICDGISDWTWTDPGLGILNCRMTVSDATPVTGWVASATAGQAGLCVANDGQSVISGFTLAYATEGIAIWENVLGFMWSGGSALERSSWAEIKTSF